MKGVDAQLRMYLQSYLQASGSCLKLQPHPVLPHCIYVNPVLCRPVVIMAERDKEWMDGEVQGALKGYKVNWQTRQGAPYAAADLAKV